MPIPLVAAVVTASLLTVLSGVVVSLRGRSPGRVTVGLGVLAAVAVLVLSGWAAARLVAGERPPELATTIGYLLGIVVVLPLGLAWALADRNRYSGYVVAVAGFTVAVMTARVVMLWRGPVG